MITKIVEEKETKIINHEKMVSEYSKADIEKLIIDDLKKHKLNAKDCKFKTDWSYIWDGTEGKQIVGMNITFLGAILSVEGSENE